MNRAAQHYPRTSHASGFTLIEIISVIAISAILLSLALPSMSSLMARFERDAITAQLRQNVSAARQIAIRRGRTITVCGVDEQLTCIRHGFATLAVFEDNNRNGAWDDEEIRYRLTEIKQRGELWMSASLGRSYIRFSESGSAKQAGSFIYCRPQQPTLAARVTVSMPGRTYTAVDLNGDGRVATASGNEITC